MGTELYFSNVSYSFEPWHVSKIYQLLTGLGLPSMWLKGKNWKPHGLEKMCHPVIVWFTLQLFEIQPISLTLEVFLFQGNSPCCDVRDLRTLTFFCKWEKEDCEKSLEKGELAWTLLKLLLGRLILESWHERIEGTENTFF